MLRVLWERWRQRYRTVGYPAKPPVLPDRLRGRPRLEAGRCPAGCRACAEVCPTGAVRPEGDGPAIDTGLCVFCGACEKACPARAIAFAAEHQLAAAQRADLCQRAGIDAVARAVNAEARRLFGRSLKLRQVSAGGCNACEADVNVLNTVVFDLGRFGISFVASPRHADGLLVTGPVPQNMRLALEKTYAATPAPKIVIAVGACAISGGVYAGSPAAGCGAAAVTPVDLFVPGCPPHPLTILDGLLRFLGRIEEPGRRSGSGIA